MNETDLEKSLRCLAQIQRLLVRNGLTHRQREKGIEFAISLFTVGASEEAVERLKEFRVEEAAKERS
jgi:hypothetical protein